MYEKLAGWNVFISSRWALMAYAKSVGNQLILRRCRSSFILHARDTEKGPKADKTKGRMKPPPANSHTPFQGKKLISFTIYIVPPNNVATSIISPLLVQKSFGISPEPPSSATILSQFNQIMCALFALTNRLICSLVQNIILFYLNVVRSSFIISPQISHEHCRFLFGRQEYGCQILEPS
jgi:hypothetical protein